MREDVIEHFRKNDPLLFSIIEKLGSVELLEPDTPVHYFSRLCREIVGQQLADKASEAIFARFEKLFGSRKITAEAVLKIPHCKLRKVGLSNAKAQYLKNLAEKIKNKELKFENFSSLDNEEIIQELCQVKGIGRWTAEMFLMFTLAKEDVFSHGDLGLRKAIKRLYKFKKEPSEKQIETLSQKWIPYRTYACCLLWRSLSD